MLGQVRYWGIAIKGLGLSGLRLAESEASVLTLDQWDLGPIETSMPLTANIELTKARGIIDDQEHVIKNANEKLNYPKNRSKLSIERHAILMLN